MPLTRLFTRFANAIAHAAGRPLTFVACCALIVGWAVTGPLFGFSDTWQLVVNTGTTVVTFLMVFLIQNTQNRDGAAIQVKLDELIRTSEARNLFVGIEHLTDEELDAVRRACERDTEGATEDRDGGKRDKSALMRSFGRLAGAPSVTHR